MGEADPMVLAAALQGMKEAVLADDPESAVGYLWLVIPDMRAWLAQGAEFSDDPVWLSARGGLNALIAEERVPDAS